MSHTFGVVGGRASCQAQSKIMHTTEYRFEIVIRGRHEPSELFGMPEQAMQKHTLHVNNERCMCVGRDSVTACRWIKDDIKCTSA